MKVLSPIARKRYAQAGATVDEATQVVRIDRGLVAKALATTPSEFTFQALDPEFNVQSGRQERLPRADVRSAEHHGHPPRAPCRHVRGLLQPDEAVAELRRDPHARWRRRTAGRPGAPAALRDDAVDAAAVRQGAVHLLARLAADRGLLRTDPHRPPGERRGVQAEALRVDGDQHELAAAARHPDGRGHHRLRRGGAGADHHAVHAGGRDGAGDDHGRTDARACRGARRHHAGAERATGHADPLRQLYLERRHEVGFAGVRHARVCQGRVRRRPARALHQGAVAFVERDGFEHARRAGRVRSADEPVGRADGRRQLHAARRRLGRRRALDVLREIHHGHRDAADVRRGVPAGRRRSVGHGARGDRRSRLWRALLRLRAHDGALPHGVLHAADLRLAQLRHLVQRRLEDRDRARQRRLPGDAGALRRARARSGAWSRQ